MNNKKAHILLSIKQGNEILVRTKCPFCTEERTDSFPLVGYNEWIAGKYIQDAMRNVSKDLREILITGICPTCWNETFNETEE